MTILNDARLSSDALRSRLKYRIMVGKRKRKTDVDGPESR